MLNQAIKYFEEFFEQLGALMMPDQAPQPIPVKIEVHDARRSSRRD